MDFQAFLAIIKEAELWIKLEKLKQYISLYGTS